MITHRPRRVLFVHEVPGLCIDEQTENDYLSAQRY